MYGTYIWHEYCLTTDKHCTSPDAPIPYVLSGCYPFQVQAKFQSCKYDNYWVIDQTQLYKNMYLASPAL